jgi:hypothetical protein
VSRLDPEGEGSLDHTVEPEVRDATSFPMGPLVAEFLHGLAHRIEFAIPQIATFAQLADS